MHAPLLPSILLLFLLPGCSSAPGPSGSQPPIEHALGNAAEALHWEFTDPAAFRWTIDAGQGCLELFAPANHRPPHRSPLGLALLRGPELGDGTMRVQARQTGREYPHRDLVLVFGYRDAAHFAYAHLASVADANAHHVMLVDGADRRPITIQRTGGVVWGDGWHDLELRRTGDHVEVRFDSQLVLSATTPAWRGRVGLGSFDDTGRFRALRIEPR